MPKQKTVLPAEVSSEYEIGFGKPPKTSQFKKGQSGNPNGRPRGTKNTATVARAVLNEKIAIQENGRQKVVTKREALIKQLINRSLQGDVAFLRLVINHILPAVDAAQNEAVLTAGTGIDDAMILGPLLKQFQGSSTLTIESSESEADNESGASPPEGKEGI